MNAGTPISQFEKATAIPDETLYIVEMGDGSGTKVVTQKTLTEEVGKGLKVGNLEDLQTENTENLVDAINEAAQSGGGGSAVDILDTKEEIEANTEPGKAAGAQAVKEMFGALNDNLQGLFEENIGQSYFKFPNGLIIQWGNGNGTTKQWVSLPLPIEFPQNNYIVIGSHNGGGTFDIGVAIKKKDSKNIQAYNYGGTNAGFSFIAIGY